MHFLFKNLLVIWQNRNIFFFSVIIFPLVTLLYFNNQQHKIDSTIKLKGYELKNFDTNKFASSNIKIKQRKNKVLVTVFSSDGENAKTVAQKTNTAIVSDISFNVLNSLQNNLRDNKNKMYSLQKTIGEKKSELKTTKDKYKQNIIRNDILTAETILQKITKDYGNYFHKIETFSLNSNIRVDVKEPIRNEEFLFKIILSVIAALIVSFVFGWIIEMFNNTYTSSSEIKEDLGIKTLEGLAKFSNVKYINNELVSSHIKLYNLTEIARIFSYIYSKKKRTIEIVSSVRSEGNTSLAYSLAQHASKKGHKTLIIDMDLRNKFLSSISHSSVVNWNVTPDSDYKDVDANIININTDLDFLPALSDKSSLEVLKASNQLTRLLNHLKEKYEYIFIDTSAVTSVNINNIDPIVLSNSTDAVIVNYLLNRTSKNKLHQTIDKLKMIDSKVLAIVTNRRYKAKMKDEMINFCDVLSGFSTPLSNRLKTIISKSYILDEE